MPRLAGSSDVTTTFGAGVRTRAIARAEASLVTDESHPEDSAKEEETLRKRASRPSRGRSGRKSKANQSESPFSFGPVMGIARSTNPTQTANEQSTHPLANAADLNIWPATTPAQHAPFHHMAAHYASMIQSSVQPYHGSGGHWAPSPFHGGNPVPIFYPPELLQRYQHQPNHPYRLDAVHPHPVYTDADISPASYDSGHNVTPTVSRVVSQSTTSMPHTPPDTTVGDMTSGIPEQYAGETLTAQGPGDASSDGTTIFPGYHYQHYGTEFEAYQAARALNTDLHEQVSRTPRRGRPMVANGIFQSGGSANGEWLQQWTYHDISDSPSIDVMARHDSK